MKDVRPVKFGKYILLDRIAAGGMAELYRAKITGAEGFEKLIAIKKILPHLNVEDALVSAFIDEAKLAAFLQHQNIVQIYDFGSMENTYFIAMEYLFGKDLRFVIRKSKQTGNPLGLENTLHIAARICDGLYYAHNLRDFHGKPFNIIHRDIGPHNIFITYDGQVKVIDFGIAKAASQSTSTQEGLIKGKVAYMSPEHARGKTIDHRSDIYSIGILLYEMVTHKRMFVGDTLQIYAKACKAEYEPPEKVNKNLPSDLYAILHQALAKDPRQRYQSADEMAADLDKCISGLSFRPTARSLSQHLKALFEEEVQAEERALREAALFDYQEMPEPDVEITEQYEPTMLLDTTPAPEKPKSRTRLYAAVGLVLVVGGLILALTFLNQTAEKPPLKKAVISSPASGPDGSRQEAAIKALPDNQVPTAPLTAAPASDSQKMPVPPKPDPIEFIQGQKLMEAERFAEAVALFENILENEPAMQDRVNALYSRALQGQAAQLEAQDQEMAQKLLLKSLAVDPDNAAGYYQLGRIYTKQKQYPNAIASYHRAVQLNPDLAPAYFNLGYIYYAIKKDYSQAHAMYQRTVALDPPFLDEALFNLALVQNKLGKRQESIQSLERAISVNPENKQAQKFLEYLRPK